MSDKHYPVSVRLTEAEKQHLETIASEEMLNKKDGSLSLGLALKNLIKTSMLEKNNPKKNDLSKENHQKLSRIEHMLEQMHVTMPHILYHARYSSSYCNYALRLNKISEPERCEFGSRVVENVYQICGDFQGYQYQTIYVSSDNKNMQTMPIEKDKNKWKLN